PVVEAAPPPRTPPTLDEIFRKVSRSLVWVHKLDESGHRTDTATGFILEPGRIVTAFQAVDSAARLELEFPGGRKVTVDALAGFSRNGDWAVLRADTGDLPAIPRGDPKAIAVGERLIVFNVESEARVIGGIDVGGRRFVPGFGDRIQLSPGVARAAVGGPLLDAFGRVAGVLGGSITPGSRFDGRSMGVSPALWNNLNANNAAVPITEVTVPASAEPATFKALLDAGTLTAPITAMPEFMYGGTTQSLPKSATGPTPRDASEFARTEPQVFVYSLWSRKGKIGKGMLSAKVYDSGNRLAVEVPPKKISLGEIPIRSAFGFSPATLKGGMYRVDLLWDGKPVWRTFIVITE
ncbi:MAG: serine protease, partial [Acidobacteriota bacterium]|nr:serine protease [Acidobacteriota bacterium]